MSGLFAAAGKVIPGLDTLLSPKVIQAPAPKAPPPMPVPNDAALKAAQRKEASLRRQRGGRASTILTALGSETLG